MQNNNENVILFPTWQKDLEIESLQALKQKNYTGALPMLNELLSYNVNNHEIVIGKLICLMELGEYDEAQNLCEDLLDHKNENYYHYVHIYLTILFQTNQYEALMNQVEYELEDDILPSIVEEQFRQLYEMAGQMKSDVLNEKSSEYIIELAEAIKEENHLRQWQLVENLRKMKIEPTDQISHYLVDDDIHPVIKTTIFKWLQDKMVSQDIEIHKLDLQLTVKPTEVSKIRDHIMIKQVMLLINELEQENPSLFILLEQLLYRYAYVRFPIMPQSYDVLLVSEALKIIGNEYLYIHTTEDTVTEDVAKYIAEIKMCEKLYLSIIEE